MSELSTQAHLRIIDPSVSNDTLMKYKPLDSDSDRIDQYVIKDFVNDFIGGRLQNFLRS